MRILASAWETKPDVQQVVAQLPWGHLTVLLDKLETLTIATGMPTLPSHMAGHETC
jgi:hypothetical protein